MSTAYTTDFRYKPETLVVSKNGIRLVQGSIVEGDFHISGVEEFTLNVTKIATDEVAANYKYFDQSQVGSVIVGTTTVTTTYTITPSDSFVLCDASGGAFTVTLPLAPARAGQLPVTIKKIDSSANTVTVDTTGADKLDNEDDQELSAEGEAIICMSDGVADYHVG